MNRWRRFNDAGRRPSGEIELSREETFAFTRVRHAIDFFAQDSRAARRTACRAPL